MRYVLAFLLDCLGIVALGMAVLIVVTGGAAFTVGHLRISARSPDNLLLFLAILLAARYAIRETPWLAVWPTRPEPIRKA